MTADITLTTENTKTWDEATSSRSLVEKQHLLWQLEGTPVTVKEASKSTGNGKKAMRHSFKLFTGSIGRPHLTLPKVLSSHDVKAQPLIP